MIRSTPETVALSRDVVSRGAGEALARRVLSLCWQWLGDGDDAAFLARLRKVLDEERMKHVTKGEVRETADNRI